MLYALAEACPVGQPGERIVKRLVEQLLFEPLALRHVNQRSGNAGDGSVWAGDRPHLERDLPDMVSRTIFWTVEDLRLISADLALADPERQVLALLDQLATQPGVSGDARPYAPMSG